MSDYDKGNSGAYTEIDDKPYVAAVESPSVMELVSAKGKSVLDYGCGSGKYSRWCKRAGATHVLGVDTSQDQIDLAQAQETKEPLGVEYRCIEADPEPLGEFDVVMSIWVVIVAETPEQVGAFFRHAFENLKPGGKYLMWTSLVPEEAAGQERLIAAYDSDGIHFDIEAGSAEPVKTTLTIGDFVAPNFFYRRETFERLLKEAGFSTVEVVPAKAQPSDERWDAFARDTAMCGVVATKP